ncbi:hypothetical protein [Pseudoduganella violaceinigra]|uniref:hypothetical protein n=1 Tax=Pseudoduganella violaceinigra TaxID=246602 RepID=UPI000482A170|nr:hypothetical protein [Pseudoduganella violaceinigra]
MPPNLCIAISESTLRALLAYREEQGGQLDAAGIADLAIRDWLQRQADLAKPSGQHGYLWKKVFLPDGTRLRISSHSATRYAAIVGDDLVHHGMLMSPNQFAQMTLGSTRSAWQAIQIQMPGTREWTPATRLRQTQEAPARGGDHHAAAQAQTPAPAPPPCARALPPEDHFAPRLRPDRQERRMASRRAEDLLLD